MRRFISQRPLYPVTLGRLLAFGFSIALGYALWSRVFTSTDSGSNVLLGMLMGIAGVYLTTTSLGAYLDDAIFHGGDRHRAVLHRHLRAIVEDARTLSKGKRGAAARAQLQEPLASAEAALAGIEAAWADAALAAGHADQLRTHIEMLEKAVTAASKRGRGTSWLPLATLFGGALLLRFFVIEPFQIPSSSMVPTLLIGDHLFVAKFRYGLPNPVSSEPDYLVRWSTPQPGDVIVFEAPMYAGPNGGEDWIKRVIAGPGQSVFLKDGVIHVDGKPYAHTGPGAVETYMDYHQQGRSRWFKQSARAYQEHIPADGGEVVHTVYHEAGGNRQWPQRYPQLSSTGLTCGADACTVNPGHVFVMGDNRDNSSDGRTWGAVPVDNVKGKAFMIWMSADGSSRSVSVGKFTLPGFRWSRWLSAIK